MSVTIYLMDLMLWERGCGHTAVEDLPSCKSCRKSNRIRKPFALNDEAAEDQKARRDINAIDEGGRRELARRVGHGELRSRGCL